MKTIFFLIMFIGSISYCFCQTCEEYFKRGLAKANAGDEIGAIIEWDKAIRIDTTHAGVYYNRGFAKGKLKDYKGAMADYNKAIEIVPDYTEAYYMRGLIKSMFSDDRGAIADFDIAIMLNSKYAEAYFARGLAKYHLIKVDEGCLDWSKAGELGYYEAYDMIKQFCN